MLTLLFVLAFLIVSLLFIYAFVTSKTYKAEGKTSKRFVIVFLTLFFGIPNYFSLRSGYETVFTEVSYDIPAYAKKLLQRYDLDPQNGQIDLAFTDEDKKKRTFKEGSFKEDHGSSYIRYARGGLFLAADADSNAIATVSEIETLLRSFDTNKDGKLNGELSLKEKWAGNYHENELTNLSKTHPESSKSLVK